jgi:hypothetical protein
MKLALLAVAVLAADAHADCAMYGLAPKVLTPANAVVPSDGGIIVAAEPEQGGKLDPGDPAVQPWKIRAGADTLRPPVESIAPGLAVYRVAMPNAFKVELFDGAKVVATVRPARGSGDRLAEPKVKQAWFEEQHARHGSSSVRVELDAPVPAGVVAIVLADAKGAKSWGPVTENTNIVVPFSSPDCVALPNGTRPSRSGDKVFLMWVAADGRVSSASKTLTIVPK